MNRSTRDLIIDLGLILVLCFLVALALNIAQAHAQDWQPVEPDCQGDRRVEQVNEGEPVPFDGQALTNDAAACLVTRYDLAVESCRVELVRRDALAEADVGECEALRAADVAALEAERDALEQELIDAHDVSFWESGAFALAVGVVVGVAGTVAVVLVLN